MELLIVASLWVAGVGAGMMAGLYFAFSTFIMTALAALPTAEGVRAMQSINKVILGSAFMPLFAATSLVSLALVGVAAARWDEPGTAAMLGGALVYLIGMFACTAARNVPLNNTLARVEPAAADAAAVWAHYRRAWLRWNHVRTVASALACILFVAALLAGAG